MARTRNWATEEAGFTDATMASSIDDKGTALRQDTREVINQLLGVAEGTALADPVVATDGVTLATLYPLGKVQTFVVAIPWSAFWWRHSIRATGGGSLDRLFDVAQDKSNIGLSGGDGGYLQVEDPTASNLAQTGLVQGVYGLVVPVGITFTGLSFEFYRTNAAEQVTLTLLSNSATTAGASTTIATATSTGSTTGSMQSVNLGTLSTTTVADTFYRIEITITGAAANTQQRLYGGRLTYTSPSANVRL